MIGLARLQNIQECVTDVIEHGVAGDLIETGVWRGGASIFMRAILKAYGDTGRKAWVANSFEGIPMPNPEKYPADAAEENKNAFYKFDQLAPSVEQVRENFARYNLLDNQVSFLKGRFRETFPTIPATQRFCRHPPGWRPVRVHMDAITVLYPKLSVGGYCLVDDYGGIPACRAAVDEYRSRNRLKEPIQSVDRSCIFWQKAE
jgi:O-methyltransferase